MPIENQMSSSLIFVMRYVKCCTLSGSGLCEASGLWSWRWPLFIISNRIIWFRSESRQTWTPGSLYWRIPPEHQLAVQNWQQPQAVVEKCFTSQLNLQTHFENHFIFMLLSLLDSNIQDTVFVVRPSFFIKVLTFAPQLLILLLSDQII